MKYEIRWSEEAVRNLEQILRYLATEWSAREVQRFKEKLSNQLTLIQKFPHIFPASGFAPRLRKATLNKQIILFYEIKGRPINLVCLFDGRQNPNKIV